MSITAENIKSKIIEVAAEFFSYFGFKKTRMDEIAKRMHKAKGLLYYYFKSKEDLYKEVLQKELGDIMNQLKKIIEDENLTPFEKVEMYFKNRVKLMSQAKNYHETLRADFFERYHFVDSVREDFEKFELEALKKIIMMGVESKCFYVSDIDAGARLLLLLLKSSEAPLYLQNKYSEYEKVIDELISTIINGLKTNNKNS